MHVELRFTADQWGPLVGSMRSERSEMAAVLICGTVRREDYSVLLVREVVMLGPNDLEGSSQHHLAVSPLSIARLAKRARLMGLTLVLCHSHPFAGEVRPSNLDKATEADLCGRVLARILHPLPVGALIIGWDGADGRVWDSLGQSPIDEIRIVGDQIEFIPPRRGVVDDRNRVSRQIAAWGETGQQELAGAKVVIVGLGGTGSHVALQLAHLGVRSVLLIDDDDIDESNLSRLVGSEPTDVGRKKVRVIEAAMRRINASSSVRVIPHSLLEIDYELLADADVIFCCTDGHGSRALLTELCAQYLLPVIDLGVEIQPGHVLRAGGGIRILRPGSWCLNCAGTLDYTRVREEFLSQKHRIDEGLRGYLRGANVIAPSVISLNGVVSSMAVLEFCELMCGFFGRRIDRVLYRAESRAITSATVTSDARCHVCGSLGLLGLGESRVLPSRSA